MKKIKTYIAGAVLLVCIIAACLGYNSFIQSIGFLSAGFLFGSQTERPSDPNLVASKQKVKGDR